jgi:hypothetical protein
MGIDLEGKLGTPDAAQDGSIAASNAAVTFFFSGASEGITISGTWSGTLSFEATIDGTTWFSIKALNVATWLTVTTTTANGNFIVPCAEYQATRVRFSAYTSGTASIYIFGANAMQLIWAGQQGPWVVDQGLPNTVANSWPIKITDGVDVADVKTNNELKTSDVFETSIYSTNITVGTSAVEAKVGASPIINRKGIEIFHNGANKLYYGAAGVTTTTGIQIFKNTCKFINAGPNVHIYLVSDQAGQDVRVVELA